MSILYKGLNPKNHYGLCILTIDGELITADGKHYQAIQIHTPHGRIIDEDEIYEQPHCGECNDATLDAIDNAPTILEAET